MALFTATEIDTVTVDTFEGEVSIMSARPTPSDLATEVWRDIAKRSFAVIAHVKRRRRTAVERRRLRPHRP
jgi:hypothetical protein